jgi:phage tail-like protein
MTYKRASRIFLVGSIIAVSSLVAVYLIFTSLVDTEKATQTRAEAAILDGDSSGLVFFIQIDGDSIPLRNVSGISAETQVVEAKQGNDKATVKLAGPTAYSNLVLTRGLTEDLKFSDWFAKTASGTPEKKAAAIVISDFAGETIAQYNFTNALPCKYSLSPFDGVSTGHLTETMELCYDRFTRVSP